MNNTYLISISTLIALSAASCSGASPEKQHAVYVATSPQQMTAYDSSPKNDELIPAAAPATLTLHDIDTIEPIALAAAPATLTFADISDDTIEPIALAAAPAPLTFANISDHTIEPIALATAPAPLTFHDIFESDTFESIINFLDQKSLIQMLRVNTKYNQVMKNIMARTCSQLIQQHQGDLSQALFTAIENNMLYAVNYLIQNRANVNALNENGVTMLILATDHNNEPIVKKLLKAKANIDARDSNGRTALMLATDRNYATIVTHLSNALKAQEYKNSIQKKARFICSTLGPVILFVVMLPLVNHMQIITNTTHYYNE